MKILFIAANPSDATRLRLDKEIREIDARIQQTPLRDQIEVISHWAVGVRDLQNLLLRHKPDIVHFSGHSNSSSEIILEDNFGNSHPVSVGSLSELFSVLNKGIRCVVLNACFLEKQAEEIAKHVDFVIGTSKEITDSAAINFSFAFYQALGFGESIEVAFKLGRNQISLENLGEQYTPRIIESTKRVIPDKFENKSHIKLVEKSTDPNGLIFETSERLVTIGRAPKNSIQIPNGQVSWEHSQIILMQGSYYYHHLSKRNPSILRRRGEEYLLQMEGKNEILLQNQDRLTIGGTTFVIEFDLVNEDVGYTTTEKNTRMLDYE